MKSEKTIEELEQELVELKEQHKSMWDTYGSELCAGDMIRKEEELENEIKITKLNIIRDERKNEDPSLIVDK